MIRIQTTAAMRKQNTQSMLFDELMHDVNLRDVKICGDIHGLHSFNGDSKMKMTLLL